MFKDRIGIKGIWTIRGRDRNTGLTLFERQVKNVWTNYGLTALASAPFAGYVQPQYLVIESFASTLYAAASIGNTVVNVVSQPTLVSDTQLVLSPGLANQEIVTFTAVTNMGAYYQYTLSGTVTKSHPINDPVCRNTSISDTMSSVTSEQQYDSVNAPGKRIQSVGGYSASNGNGTIQFYLPGPSAQSYIVLCGLSDSQTIGQGNLHNHFVLGYNHTSTTTDLEIDGSITLSNI